MPDEDAHAIYQDGSGECHDGNLESNDWYKISLMPGYYGDNIQGAVCSFLWDLVDDPAYDDDDFAIPFNSLFGRFAQFPFASGHHLWVAEYASMLLWKTPAPVIPDSKKDQYCDLLHEYRIYMGGPYDLGQICGEPTDVSISQEEAAELPKRFAVTQNYPNPFNGSTLLRLSIPERGEVQITVYNVLGQIVEQSESMDVGPGEHVVNIGLTEAATGVYFTTVSYRGETKTLKMLYMK